VTVANENESTSLVFPLPIEMMRAFARSEGIPESLRTAAAAATGEGDGSGSGGSGSEGGPRSG